MTETKLGPSVTYTNPTHDAKLVTIAGVLLREGQSVNLEEQLGAVRAAPILKKLSQNTHFQVEGGPDWSKVKAPAQVREDPGVINAAQREEPRLRQVEGDDAADRYVASLGPDGAQPQAKDDAEAKAAEANYKA